jgi:hypothetical protein
VHGSGQTKSYRVVIQKNSLMEGKEFSAFQELLKDTMSVRNAFAHGTFTSDDKTVSLSYFEGQPKTQELTDDYLRKIEKILWDAWQATFQLAVKTGTTKMLNPSEERPPDVGESGKIDGESSPPSP